MPVKILNWLTEGLFVVHSSLLYKAVMKMLSKVSSNQEIKMVNIWKEF